MDTTSIIVESSVLGLCKLKRKELLHFTQHMQGRISILVSSIPGERPSKELPYYLPQY